jgi:hypothetical protein
MNTQQLICELGADVLDPWPYFDRHLPTDPQWHFERDSEPGSHALLARVLYRNPKISRSMLQLNAPA